MKFSIITAVRNNLDMLKLAIDNLASQKDVSYEHIIMDGNSSDGTKEFLQTIEDSRISPKSEHDKSIYDALNKGMRLSRNEIIGLLHSDDFFADDLVLSDVKALFEQGADIVFADLEYVDRNNSSRTLRLWKSGAFHPNELPLGWMPPHPTFFFRREVLANVGEYSLEYSIAADYDFMLKCLTQPSYEIAYLPRVATKMRVGGESNKSLKNILKKSQQDFHIAQKYFNCPLRTVLFKNLRKLKQIQISHSIKYFLKN